jgi:hypothetical protein
MAEKTLKKGHKVSWKSSGGTAHGKVVKKQTTPTKIKGHEVKASKDNPQYCRNERGKESGAQGGEFEEGVGFRRLNAQITEVLAPSTLHTAYRDQALSNMLYLVQ